MWWQCVSMVALFFSTTALTKRLPLFDAIPFGATNLTLSHRNWDIPNIPKSLTSNNLECLGYS